MLRKSVTSDKKELTGPGVLTKEQSAGQSSIKWQQSMFCCHISINNIKSILSLQKEVIQDKRLVSKGPCIDQDQLDQGRQNSSRASRAARQPVEVSSAHATFRHAVWTRSPVCNNGLGGESVR